MLLPHQVLPFLCDPRVDVRSHAAKYLMDLGDSAPPETAAAAWSAIDQFGESTTATGFKQNRRFLTLLTRVPGDEASLNRALDALAAPALDREETLLLNRIIENTRLDLLELNLQRILVVVDEKSSTAIEHRLSLRSLSPLALWEQLVREAEKADAVEDDNRWDSTVGPRLVEALSHHPADAAPLAMQVLANPQERWWLEIWSADLLGQIRHAPAIDLLIEAAQIEDADYLRQSAAEALVRMEPALVVPRLVAVYPSEDPFQRDFIAEALAKIKNPLSEEASISLLAGEKDKSPSTMLAMGLCDLCSTNGMEPVRQLILSDRYDIIVADLKELLLTTSAITGFDFPEREKWTAELADPAYRERNRELFLRSFGITKKLAEQFQKYLQNPDGFLGDDQPDESPAVTRLFDPPRQVLPYRREEPKIGRNDPCPCGSGKKYKKCCGK